MQHIKKFETFDFSQTLPITTKNFLTNYYSCDECDGLWKSFNKEDSKCKFCESEEIEEMSEGDWNEIVNQRMGKDSESESDDEEMVDLVTLKNESKIYDHSILPTEALEELKSYVDYEDPKNKVQVYPDPRVEGTYAVRIYRSSDDFTFDLLWNRGAFDELDFETWPPKSGDLKFFF